MKQIDPREIAGFTAAVTAAVTTAVAALPKAVPLTTTVGGVPELVWDANNELVLVEVVL